MNEVIKCVIPAAGRGTRLLPLTAREPKEMLTVGGRPLIDRVIDEALASGMSQICLISSPGKREMEERVRSLLEKCARPDVSLRCLRQDRPRGLARALALARDFVGGDAFALLLPDNIVLSPRPVLRQMAAAFFRYGLSINALTNIASAREGVRFGNSGKARLELVSGPVFRVKAIQPKGEGSFPWAPGRENLRLYPRAILRPEFFKYLAVTAPPREGEFDDVPVFQKLAEAGGLLAFRTQSRVIDAGNPAGLEYARRYFRRFSSG